MNEGFRDCFKRERDITVKLKFSEKKKAFRVTPALINTPRILPVGTSCG